VFWCVSVNFNRPHGTPTQMTAIFVYLLVGWVIIKHFVKIILSNVFGCMYWMRAYHFLKKCSVMRISSWNYNFQQHLQGLWFKGKSKQQVPLKCWQTSTRSHSTTTLKTTVFILNAVRTSNPTEKELFTFPYPCQWHSCSILVNVLLLSVRSYLNKVIHFTVT
jgi:hypothetical protein